MYAPLATAHALLEVGHEVGDGAGTLLDRLTPDMDALSSIGLPEGVMGVSVTVRGAASFECARMGIECI